ncbi:S-adenosyl-L-methionine-dependent methyltransferase [Trichocladium antarcticum]|uniref:Sterol 24-C-methyltransferase n=1 Tax=Trichocladium antarcticum TaxID=1450529 RepID=A0AAN6UHG0_9PEZI|nr:S-adenosyl-L-methionine-dependent methyltransferase [Trichocladium antarcticum]
MGSPVPVGFQINRDLNKFLAHYSRDPSKTNVIDVDCISWSTEAERQERQKKYCEVATDYYNLVSFAYEKGWGQHFHYAPLTPGLSLTESIKAYEREYGHIARLRKGMRVLDLGCGVGGPARTIAREIGCTIVGITNSAWHVARGTALTKEAGLDHLITLKLPFPDESFDAVYSVEALCYSTDTTACYKEINRVMKPGTSFTFHDFAMTENSPAPWYYGPAGNIWWAMMIPGWADFWKVFKMTPFFRFFLICFFRLLVLVGQMPSEMLTLLQVMWYCRTVTIGAKEGLFTPMYLFVCQKPAASVGAGKTGRRSATEGESRRTEGTAVVQDH